MEHNQELAEIKKINSIFITSRIATYFMYQQLSLTNQFRVKMLLKLNYKAKQNSKRPIDHQINTRFNFPKVVIHFNAFNFFIHYQLLLVNLPSQMRKAVP